MTSVGKTLRPGVFLGMRAVVFNSSTVNCKFCFRVNYKMPCFGKRVFTMLSIESSSMLSTELLLSCFSIRTIYTTSRDLCLPSVRCLFEAGDNVAHLTFMQVDLLKPQCGMFLVGLHLRQLGI